jgi:hypothetical protein
MVVPWQGAERTSIWPPSAARRSAMFRRPDPSGVVRASYPTPSSDTMKRSVPSPAYRQIRAAEALAYFAVFCSASRQQKYAAASVS